MAAPTLEFVESDRAPFELGDGELVVEKLKFTRDSLGGTWAEPTDGAEAQHNGRPLEGRARLADGDVLQVGGTRLRYSLPNDDWSAVSEATGSIDPPLPAPPQTLAQAQSAPLPMLPSLADEFDSPQTQQMSPEEIKRLTQNASKPITIPTVPDGPEELPPPPVGDTPTGPALVLPPPVSATAKSRLASAFAKTVLPDSDFGGRTPVLSVSLASADSEAITGTREDSDVREMSEVSGVEVVSSVSEPSLVSNVETNTGVLREPTTGVLSEPTTGVLREPTTDVLREPTTGVLGEPLRREPPSLGDSAETTTGVDGEVSEITVPREQQSPTSEPLLRSIPSPSAPVTGPTEVRPPPEERLDPTLPSLHSIEVPTLQGAGMRARKFARALLAAPSVRGVLIIDLLWAVPFGVLLGWVTTRTGDAWGLACAGGVTLLAITTFISGARVAPKVSGLTLASARGQLAVGVNADVVAVGRLRALVGIPLMLLAGGALFLGPHTLAGAGSFFGLATGALVFDTWLRSAYTACFAAWARACERAQSLDVRLAPPPLAKAFER